VSMGTLQQVNVTDSAKCHTSTSFYSLGGHEGKSDSAR